MLQPDDTNLPLKHIMVFKFKQKLCLLRMFMHKNNFILFLSHLMNIKCISYGIINPASKHNRIHLCQNCRNTIAITPITDLIL